MPIVQPGSTVLVTGANGYIGSWTVKLFLEARYNVVGTVRSREKGDALVQLFEKEVQEGKVGLRYVVVEDITADGAFDEAVNGVHAIVHTASPVSLDIEDPEDLIVPAIKGVVGILKSALEHGANVKRIITLSSAAAVLSIHPNPRVFSELDWNDQSIEQTKELGKNAVGFTKYRASKTLAEKSAWEFMRRHEEELKGRFDLVAFQPPFVFGPQIPSLHLAKPEEMTFSSYLFYKATILGTFHVGSPVAPAGLWVDVRDLAEITLLAVTEKEEAGGERVIVSTGPFVWQDFLNATQALNPPPFDLSRTGQLPRGEPGTTGKDVVHPILYDTSKMERMFGLKMRSIEESTKDIVSDYARRVW